MFTESSATSSIFSSLSLMHHSNSLIKTEASSLYLYNKSYLYKITIITESSIKSRLSISFLIRLSAQVAYRSCGSGLSPGIELS